MDKLELIETLIVMIQTGEIKLGVPTRESDELLRRIWQIVWADQQLEIVRDITDIHTEYFAPEFDSWHDFLNYCNGSDDYSRVLDGYTEEQMELLWQNSHVQDALDEMQIKTEMIKLIGQRKVLELAGQTESATGTAKRMMTIHAIDARLRGLYSMLYD